MRRMHVVSLITETFSREDASSSPFFSVSRTESAVILVLFPSPGCEAEPAVASALSAIASVDLADTAAEAAFPYLPHYF